MTQFIGIDMSKDSFVVFYPQSKQSATFKNTSVGVAHFIATLSTQDHCVLEATGTYSYLLTYSLCQQQKKVSVVSPLAVKRFAQAQLKTIKNDKTDARLLASFGEVFQPALYRMPDESLRRLKQQRTALRVLKKQQTQLKGVLHSFEFIPDADKVALKALQKALQVIDKQVETLQAQLSTHIEQDYQKNLELVCSIKGIGEETAKQIIIATNGFKNFTSARAFAKFIGIVPTQCQSGSSVNKGSRMSKSGDPQLRGMLYTCSWSAMRFNSQCKQLYNRLRAKGKSGKLALGAVMNKLLKQVFAVVQSGVKYQENYKSVRTSAQN